jgi:6-phospho-3-hexuloisomerase
MGITQTGFHETSKIVLQELHRTLAQIDEDEMHNAGEALLKARRLFFQGAGRSGLALKMAAMRMMHLGLRVYVAGEVVTPAIEKGDLLVVASGSGTTAGPVHAAEVARKAGASVLALTTAPQSPLGSLATSVLRIPAATKQGDDRTQSQQYAGALFEQTVLLLMDVLFQELWHQRGETAEQLWKRHANLE